MKGSGKSCWFLVLMVTTKDKDYFKPDEDLAPYTLRIPHNPPPVTYDPNHPFNP